jgi:CRP/FNR family transcriptional regulator
MRLNTFAPLAEGRQPRRYQPGQVIYLQDSPADEFYYLLQGTARSYISSQAGGERILTVHHAGDLMGEASFFDKCPRVSSAVAITACDIVSVDRAALDQVFRQHPELALPMLQYLARTVRLLSNHVDEATFLPAGARLARHLLSSAQAGVPFPCTHEELGFAIGASRVTVSRLLAEFSHKGLIRTGYRCVTVLDPKGLEAESGG